MKFVEKNIYGGGPLGQPGWVEIKGFGFIVSGEEHKITSLRIKMEPTKRLQAILALITAGVIVITSFVGLSKAFSSLSAKIEAAKFLAEQRKNDVDVDYLYEVQWGDTIAGPEGLAEKFDAKGITTVEGKPINPNDIKAGETLKIQTTLRVLEEGFGLVPVYGAVTIEDQMEQYIKQFLDLSKDRKMKKVVQDMLTAAAIHKGELWNNNPDSNLSPYAEMLFKIILLLNEYLMTDFDIDEFLASAPIMTYVPKATAPTAVQGFDPDMPEGAYINGAARMAYLKKFCEEPSEPNSPLSAAQDQVRTLLLELQTKNSETAVEYAIVLDTAVGLVSSNRSLVPGFPTLVVFTAAAGYDMFASPEAQVTASLH